MRRILLLIGFASFWFTSANAQSFSIRGTIHADNKPVEAATVSLLRADSTKIRQAVSDKSGQFEITISKEGDYLVSVNSVGNQTYYSTIILLDENHPQTDLKTIDLQETAKLSDVIVTSKKQFIEQKIDKTVINVDASPTNTGLSAYDILQKTPGVTVDKDGNISLKGKPGVSVMIDGKPSYLSAQDLANFLKNLP